MSLSRLKELAVAIETTPGTAPGTLYTADNAKHLVISPTVSFEVPLFDRLIGRSSLTPLPGLAGIKTGTVGFQLELAGHANVTPDIPTWDPIMRACGFKSVATTKVVYGGASPGEVMRHGEIVIATGNDAGGTARCVHDTWPVGSGGTMYLEDDNITWASSGATTLTGGTTLASYGVAASVVSEDAGQSYYPVSQPLVLITGGAITGTLAVGDILVMSDGDIALQIAGVIESLAGTDMTMRMYTGHPAAVALHEFHIAGENPATPTNYYLMTSATVVQDDIPTLSLTLNEDGVRQTITGARGTWSLDARIGEPALMTFEFTGAATSVDDTGLLTGVVFETKLPPVFLGATMALGTEADLTTSDESIPCITALNIAMNNEVTVRQCVVSPTGIKAVEITGRGVTGSIDPEQELEATYAIVGNFLAGTLMRLRTQIGSAAANSFLITMPGLQATGMGSGDRNGIATRDYQFRATGGTWTNANDTSGQDNELVITYLL